MQKRSTVRRMISLSSDLDRRMEKQNGVNWSEVARLAFENKLSELEKRKELKSMESIINRLRASKESTLNDNQQAGFDAGKEWAEQFADFQELKNLEQLREQLGNLDELAREVPNDAYDRSDHLAAIIIGISPSRHACEEFWEQAYGDSEEHAEMRRSEGFAHGFALGALEVWDQVKDAI